MSIACAWARVAPGSEPLKATPFGQPAAGPDGLTLTEPDPCALEQSGRQGWPCRPLQTTTDDWRRR